MLVCIFTIGGFTMWSLALILHLECEDETGDLGLMYTLCPNNTHAALALSGALVQKGRVVYIQNSLVVHSSDVEFV